MMLKPMLRVNFLTGFWPKIGIPVRFIRIAGSPLLFKVSTELRSEPMKAKKKIDPNIIKAREEKRRRKFEKMIQRQLKFEKQLKPVEEIDTPSFLLREKSLRERVVKVSGNVEEYRKSVLKEWSKVKGLESNSDMKLLRRIINAQKKALDELQLESKELYEAAVQIDKKLIPLKYTGPVETPPIKDYPLQDGEYIDVSRKWLP